MLLQGSFYLGEAQTGNQRTQLLTWYTWRRGSVWPNRAAEEDFEAWYVRIVKPQSSKWDRRNQESCHPFRIDHTMSWIQDLSSCEPINTPPRIDGSKWAVPTHSAVTLQEETFCGILRLTSCSQGTNPLVFVDSVSIFGFEHGFDR